jgi:peptidoglycan/LPS O-acetylase OafA/YrhL
MKRMILLNIILLSICAIFFVLDFFILEQVTRFFFFTPIIFLFIEAGVFLFTFRHMKKSTLEWIRKVLAIYCILAIAILIAIKIYTGVTGYTFIYYGYSPLLIAFII